MLVSAVMRLALAEEVVAVQTARVARHTGIDP